MPSPCQPSPCAAATTVPASLGPSASSGGFDASCDFVSAPSLSDKDSTIGGTSTAAPPFSLRDEFPKAAGMGPYASSCWSDVPIDILMRILQLLELPEALAFGAVCPSWRSASTAGGGGPPCRTPWLVTLAKEPLLEGEQWPVRLAMWDPTVTSEFRNLLNPEKAFQVSFPRGVQEVVACCGASHGWLIMANELSDLVLYNPFAMALIPLPPITAFASCIEGVYGDEGNNIVGYRYMWCRDSSDRIYDVKSLGRYFYDKVVLSGSPSLGRRCVALVVHLDGKRLSFARVRDDQGCWQQISVIRSIRDSYADCVYHNGRFYTVTMKGKVKSWDLCGLDNKLKKKVIIAEEDDDLFDDVITRYLLSTPWGHVLQVRVIVDSDRKNRVRVEIDRLDLKRRKMVEMRSATALRGHAAFLGQNSSGCLSANEFPELRPDCIYFTTPRLRDDDIFMYRRRHIEWSSVKVYDLKKQTLEAAFRSGGGKYGTEFPSEIWFTPNL